jgi:hypothetical protein
MIGMERKVMGLGSEKRGEYIQDIEPLFLNNVRKNWFMNRISNIEDIVVFVAMHVDVYYA